MGEKARLEWIIRIAILGLIVFVIVTFGVRIIWAISRSTKVDADEVHAQAILERAQDSVNSAELVLSFLEGASILLVVGLGAAALYGFQQSKELRQELEDKRKELDERVDELSKIIANALGRIGAYEPQLQNLAETRQEFRQTIENTKDSLNKTIDDVALLLQADQEFRLRNYQEAYSFSARALEHDKDNILALYITGWMETHHIPGKSEDGLKHLKMVVQTQPEWPTARAAYGVALRRKAMRLREAGDLEGFEKHILEGRGQLEVALSQNSKLVDFNRESFWGTVGGLLRDLNRIDDAIDAYQRALQVTAGSSYPQGNLAALYLNKVKNNQWDEAIALDAFKMTEEFARAELAVSPNDFFLLMDIAMASTVLLHRSNNPEKIREAKQVFDRAVQMDVSTNLLEVSRRGWMFLHENCPGREAWSVVANELNQRLRELDDFLKKQREG